MNNDNVVNDIYLWELPSCNIRKKINLLESSGYKLVRIRKLVISTYNSIRDYNPIYYIKNISKSMLIYKILNLIDDNPQTFDKYVENYNNPLSSYIKYNLFDHKDLPLSG